MKIPEKMPDTSPSYKEDNITYTADTTNMKGFVVYDQNKEGTRPGVLVVHEWWGQNDYVRNRAKQLAELGYIAMAVDMFGDGKEADNPRRCTKISHTILPGSANGKNKVRCGTSKT
jgi:dienelactone hydrolase